MTTSRRLSPPPPRQKPTIKSTASTPNIRKMAAAVATPPSSLPRSISHFRLGSESLSTLTAPKSTGDLREAAAANAIVASPITASHPDLTLEVATLSNKLIKAINNSTLLDDALGSAREENHQLTERLRHAESRNVEWEGLVQEGRLVRKMEVDEMVNDLYRKLNNEKRARELADREKRAIEMELADLSTKLFEEANQLVVAARKETEAAERRTEQVREQLADNKSLLASHQEQLAELKAIMERIPEREHDTTNDSTAPSTPALGTSGFDNVKGVDSPRLPEEPRPDPLPPMELTHLVAPVLRSDVPAFEDFKALLEINRKAASAPGSRVTSGSYGGLSIPGLGGGNASFVISRSSSQTNLAGGSSTPHSPSQSSSSQSSQTMPGTLYSPTAFLPPLRETKFYKRALAEDIDPTLRLDAAPGLSFFQRRTVSAAVNDNNLVLEPLPSTSRKLITSCTLCGERRRGDDFARTHRFKAGDESAQWYPLCAYCVKRIRTTCDYINFLRMVRDGFWRCEGKEGEEKAWEESVRLREKMFWSRIGGGVIPASFAIPLAKDEGSPKLSLEVEKKRQSKDVEGDAVATVVKDAAAATTAPSEEWSGEQGALKAAAETTETSAKPSASTTVSAAPTHNSDDIEDIIGEIRELPSTAPPLQVTSPISPTMPTGKPSSSGSMTEMSAESPVQPLRQSLTESLRRISLRESLRFGSRSRNPSTDRAGSTAATPTAVLSPKLNPVEEVGQPIEAPNGAELAEKDGSKPTTPLSVEETVEAEVKDEKQALQENDPDALDIKVPGGFS